MKRVLKIITIGVFLFAVCAPVKSQESEQREIRFYKMNKDNTVDRLRFTTKQAQQPGCHNFLRRARLHRTVQFGYQLCRIYADKDCAEESIMDFTQDGEPGSVTELSQGYSWYPVGNHRRGEPVRSWYCEASSQESSSP